MFSIWDFFCSQNKSNILCKAHKHGFHPHWTPSRLRKPHPPASVLSVGTGTEDEFSFWTSITLLQQEIEISCIWASPKVSADIVPSGQDIPGPVCWLLHYLTSSLSPNHKRYAATTELMNRLWFHKRKTVPSDDEDRKSVVGGESLRLSPNPRGNGAQIRLRLRNKWPMAVKTKGSTAAPLGSSSLRPSAEHRSLLRVEFLSKLWIITYPEEMWDSKLRMSMEWRNGIAKQWQRNTNMAMVGTTHYNLVFLYWAI